VATMTNGRTTHSGGERSADPAPSAMTPRERLLRLLGAMPPVTAAVDVIRAITAGSTVRAAILAWDGEGWRTLAGDADLGPGESTDESTDESAAGTAASAGGVAVALSRDAGSLGLDEGTLRQICVWLALADRESRAAERAAASDDEAAVSRAVVEQIMSVRDLDQVLLSITNQTLRLLDSDICGVLLREGDEVRMRSCVGHQVVETSRLRMRRGQGVAGMVFATGEVGKVDSYLQDQTISRDFMSLAEQEATQSALAVPLRAHGDLIGVLEVWRRRPSIFTERDVRRLVSLADLATIAIENARMYDEQLAMVRELRDAHGALETQVGVLRRSAALQRALLQAVLDNTTAVQASIARIIGAELGCEVALLSADRRVEAVHPATFAADGLAGRIAAWSQRTPERSTGGTHMESDDGKTVWIHPVHAGGDGFGVVCLVGGNEPAEVMEVACGQAAMACSLAHLEQRAASYARAEAFEQILWDLLHGPSEHRMAAHSRAQHMGVRLTGPHRIVYGGFDNLAGIAAHEGWDASTTDRIRRDALRALQECSGAAQLKLTSLRGDWLVAVAAVEDRAAARERVTAMGAAIRRHHPQLKISWGVSTAHTDPYEYPGAFSEAKTALSAARRLGTGGVSLYDELGIVRLLLGSGQDPDFQAFIREVTGPLMDYDRQHDGALLKTLRMFFDSDCSQKAAAARLYVHHKTLRYRLERIKELTGLDLARHPDRMRADLALRLLDVTETARDGEQTTGRAEERPAR